MKILMGFAAGVLLAGGISYVILRNQTAPAPPTQQVSAPKQAEAPPEPVALPPAPVQAEPSKPAAPVTTQVVKPAARPRAAKAPVAEPVPTPKPVETAQAAEPAAQTPPPAVEAPPLPAPTPAEPPPPPPPPPPATVTMPAGMLLTVRLSEALSSDRHQVGDPFTAVLDKPLVIDGYIVAERGAKVEGKVVESRQAGRVKGTSGLSIELTQLRTADGQNIALATETFEKAGEESMKEDVAKVGVAAGIGAAIGAIAGGGKGAGIGAAVGGAAGTGGVLATRGKAAKLAVETRITFKLKNPVTLTEKRS